MDRAAFHDSKRVEVVGDTGIHAQMRVRSDLPVNAGTLFYEAPTTYSQKKLVASGLGIATFPVLVAVGQLSDDHVRFALLDSPRIKRTLSLTTARARTPSPGAKRLLEYVQLEIQKPASMPGVNLLVR